VFKFLKCDYGDWFLYNNQVCNHFFCYYKPVDDENIMFVNYDRDALKRRYSNRYKFQGIYTTANHKYIYGKKIVESVPLKFKLNEY
jgi:hypothetical protein